MYRRSPGQTHLAKPASHCAAICHQRARQAEQVVEEGPVPVLLGRQEVITLRECRESARPGRCRQQKARVSVTDNHMGWMEPGQRQPESQETGIARSLPAEPVALAWLAFDRRDHRDLSLFSKPQGDFMEKVLHSPNLWGIVQG